MSIEILPIIIIIAFIEIVPITEIKVIPIIVIEVVPIIIVVVVVSVIIVVPIIIIVVVTVIVIIQIPYPFVIFTKDLVISAHVMLDKFFNMNNVAAINIVDAASWNIKPFLSMSPAIPC